MSVERDIRFDLIARLCPNTTGAELRSVATEVGDSPPRMCGSDLMLRVSCARQECSRFARDGRSLQSAISWTLSRRLSVKEPSSRAREYPSPMPLSPSLTACLLGRYTRCTTRPSVFDRIYTILPPLFYSCVHPRPFLKLHSAACMVITRVLIRRWPRIPVCDLTTLRGRQACMRSFMDAAGTRPRGSVQAAQGRVSCRSLLSMGRLNMDTRFEDGMVDQSAISPGLIDPRSSPRCRMFSGHGPRDAAAFSETLSHTDPSIICHECSVEMGPEAPPLRGGRITEDGASSNLCE